MDAYDIEKVQSFKKLGMSVEAITAYDDTLLVAIKGGCIMQYNTALHFDPVKMKQRVDLSNSTIHKNVSSKPIKMMEAITECSLLIIVSDNMCHVYDLNSFEFKASLPSTKGVSEIAVHVKESKQSSKVIQMRTQVKLAVAIGKKLQVLLWDGGQFISILPNELVLSKPAKKMLWNEDNLFVGFVDEYFILKPETEEVHEIPIGPLNHQERLIVSITQDLILLGIDNFSVFVDGSGHPVKKDKITWSSVPKFLVYDAPYAVAMLDKYVEVRTVDPTISVQRMDIKKVEAICQSRGLIFALTLHNVYMLVPRPKSERIKSFLNHHHYENAIQVANMSELSKEDQSVEVQKIKARWAVHLFCSKLEYDDAMIMFQELTTDPSHVIGLFPDYLPTKLHNSLNYPEKTPSLHGDDLRQASASLVCYLMEKRKIIAEREPFVPFTPITEHKRNETLKTRKQALTTIDTTLLKCYLLINEALIAPLLRQKDSHVHVKEAEKVLLREQKFSDLIILYEIHKMHEEALEMMKIQASKSKSILSGTDMTVYYLQKLGVEKLPLIFKYSEWVFETDPYQGLKIFTENDPVVEDLPRGHVLSFIEKQSLEMAILYLEHVIYEWKDKSEELHFSLSQHLTKHITNLLTSVKKKRHGSNSAKSDETGPLRKYRKKLTRFLKTSNCYNPTDVLIRFPQNCLFEEQAILQGKLRHHTKALGIYIYILQDVAKAEDFCYNVYNEDNEEDRQVYLYLLKTFLQPPEPSSLGLSEFPVPPEPNLREAISLLEHHAAHIDLCKAMDILPDDISVKKLRTYLEAAFETRLAYKNLCQIQRKMELAEFLQTSEERYTYSLKMIVVSEDTVCGHCHRKIGKSFFAYCHDGSLVHYGCVKKSPLARGSNSSAS